MSIFKSCGVMLDMSRDGVMTVSALKAYISTIAAMGINTVYLYLEDTYELPGYPMFGYMRGRYTAEELQEIDAFCIGKGMALIPCIQTLGHMAQYLRYAQASPIRDTENVMLCGAEETYHLIETMVQTMRKCITGNKLHVGMDEALELGTGKYYQLHGNCDKSVIFREHLERVCAICWKYGFTPMIWDDVARSLLKSDTQEDLATLLPKVELVPWAYGACTSKSIDERMDEIKKFDRPITFANGAWTWGSLLPHYNYAKATIAPSAKAAADNGIDSIMLTIWGDDGCQTNYNFSLNQIIMLAAYNCSGELPTAEKLVCLSEKYDCPAFEACDIASVFDQPKGIDTDVGKRLMWGDLLINSARVFDKEYAGIMNEAAVKLQPFINRKDRWQRYYEFMQLCLRTAYVKCEIVTQLRERYLKNDRNFLEYVCEKLLPELREIFIQLEKTHRALWLETYKPQGYQKVEGRYGAQLMRVQYTADRIRQYLDGKIEAIEELHEEPLPCTTEQSMMFCGQDGQVYIEYEKWLCSRHLIDVSV